jgi:3-oxoacyl-[acyl-carrier protein] reductase
MGTESFSLVNKVAVVTGAAGKKGIGRATALTLAGAGVDMVVCDVNISGKDFNLENTAEEIRKSGRRSLAVQMDISEVEDVNRMIQSVIKEYGRIDILVNNAAVAAQIPFLQDDGKLWDRVMDVNLKGCYLCSQAAGKVMVKQKQGSIINIASGAALRWFPDSSVYGMSKAGIVQFTRWLGYELGKYNIRVNAVAPTPVNTDIDSHRIDSMQIRDGEEEKFDIASRIPLGRIAEPQDIADIVLFLASDASRYITGQLIIADGGMMLSGI